MFYDFVLRIIYFYYSFKLYKFLEKLLLRFLSFTFLLVLEIITFIFPLNFVSS